MGVSVDSTFPGPGAKIANVANAILPGGPAAKAGLRVGDIILEIDGKTVGNSDELIVIVRSHNVGDRVRVKYQRGSTTNTVSLTLASK